MQVLVRPEGEEHLESLCEQYRTRRGVPLQHQHAVKLAPEDAARVFRTLARRIRTAVMECDTAPVQTNVRALRGLASIIERNSDSFRLLFEVCARLEASTGGIPTYPPFDRPVPC